MPSSNQSFSASSDVELRRKQNYNTTDLLSYVQSNIPTLMLEQKASLPDRRTAHSALKLPVSMQFIETPIATFRKHIEHGKSITKCKLIVWGECAMTYKNRLALDRSLQDLLTSKEELFEKIFPDIQTSKDHDWLTERTILVGQEQRLSTNFTILFSHIEFKRLQFLIRLALACTIKKAQSQSMELCGLNLQTDCFSHGQLYVNGGLQRLFEKCIRTFSELLFNTDLSLPFYVSICENFLRVADLVLSWNFEIHRFPVRITFANEGAPAAALRPPESWKAIFQTDEFLRLFFELSSLMGPVLTDNKSVVGQKLSTSSTSDFVSAHDRYVSNFIGGFVDIFGSGPLEGEILGFCIIVHKLLTYHQILSFPRAKMSFVTFVSIIVQCVEHLTPIAMQKALEEDDCIYIESLRNLYNGWWVMLRNNDIIESTSCCPVNFEDSTLKIISAFMRTVLSEPYGCRVKVPIQECDEEIDDDREIFKELLNDIGRFFAFYCAQMLPRMFTVLFDKVKQFLSFMERGVNDETLNTWREDMHWTLLLIGSMLTSSDDDGSSHLQNDLIDYFERVSYDGIIDIDSSVPYIKACIDSPNTITDPTRVDPLIK
ncbi:unnamed protein product [Onchocerca ochengi]|uniref:ATP-dependent DNA helicase n=1 Tax=Onchocerca ochengi TaxID=42157 RepID=A0A182EBH9_ONCOC|nr:unnamed protein product [Onchocerca ochengi]